MSKSLAERAEFVRQGANVQRFHCFNLLKPNTVGHHTFNVVGIILLCVPADSLSMSLVKHAMMHDVPERRTGDIPAPFKRSVPGLKEAVDRAERAIMTDYDLPWPELGEAELTWFTLADAMDGLFNCVEERRLGNRTLGPTFNAFSGYVNGTLALAKCNVAKFGELFDHIKEEWRKANG